MLMWATVQLGLITIVLCSVIGERERWGPRVARTIPANPLKRFVAFLFYSGAGGGTLWATLLFGATVAAYEIVLRTRPASLLSRNERVLGTHVLAEAAMCFLAYALTALTLRRTLLRRLLARATWAIGLVIFVVLAVIPPLVFLAGYSGTPQLKEHYNTVTILNPFPVLAGPTHPLRLPLLIGWVVLVFAANVPWIATQWSAFRRFNGRDDEGAIALEEGSVA
jgi:hypothetical protein